MPRATTRATVRLAVRLTPGAGADRIDGVRDGVLLARVSARPVDGAANAAMRRLVARALGVAPGWVRLVGGTTARLKRLEVDQVDPGAVRSLWPGLDV